VGRSQDEDQQLLFTVDDRLHRVRDPPFLPFFHPPIELASSGPSGRLDLDGWVDFAAICFGDLLQVSIAEIHV
jgi:hypothetical protein